MVCTAMGRLSHGSAGIVMEEQAQHQIEHFRVAAHQVIQINALGTGQLVEQHL